MSSALKARQDSDRLRPWGPRSQKAEVSESSEDVTTETVVLLTVLSLLQTLVLSAQHLLTTLLQPTMLIMRLKLELLMLPMEVIRTLSRTVQQ